MIHVSKNKCVGCGLCVMECPVGDIHINEQGFGVINRDKCINCGLCLEACPQNAIMDVREELVFAIGTNDGETITADDHFGTSKYYLVYLYSGGELLFKEKRENIRYQEDETKTHGDPGKARKVASVLEGVDVVVGKLFGPNIIRLRNKFVAVVIREPDIRNSLEIIGDGINEIIEEKDKEDRMGIILK